jgi:hypothetical protein
VVVSVALSAWWASGNDVPAVATLDNGASAGEMLPGSGSVDAGAAPTADGAGGTSGAISSPTADAAAPGVAGAPAQNGSAAGAVVADQLTAYSDFPAGGLAPSSGDSDGSNGSHDSDGPDGSDDSGPSTGSGNDSTTSSPRSDPASNPDPPENTTDRPTTVDRPTTTTSVTGTSTTDHPTTSTQPPSTQPATTTSSEPTPDRGCNVSTLLVPSCGAWFGATTPSRDGAYDYARGLDEYEAVAQNVPDILHFYKTGATTFPTAAEIAQSERPGRQRSLLLYNWKPSTTLTWLQIANGQADDNIRVVAEGLKRYPGRLFLGIHHEPEDDQGAVGSGRTPDDYVAMYRHVVTTLRELGVRNAVYVMNFMGFAGWASVADDFYPGDDVVDWIAYDPYAHTNQLTFAQLLNRPTGTWPGFYAWATARAPGKPIMLGEWGFSLANQPQSPGALDAAPDVLQTQFPMVKALVYWNNRTAVFDYRLGQQTSTGSAFDAAYARLADDPYFNATPVNSRISSTV